MDEIDAYLDYLATEATASAHTVAAYRSDLRQLAEFLSGCPWAAVTTAMLAAFAEDQRRRGHGASTMARRASAVRAFFRWAHAAGLVAADPAARLPVPRVARAPVRVVAEEVWDRLVAAAERSDTDEGQRDATLLRVVRATGLRSCEVERLDLDDVDLTQRCVCVRDDRQRVVPLDAEATAALATYLADTRPVLCRATTGHALFVNRRGGRLTRQGVWLILKGHARSAFADDPDRDALVARVSAKALRVSFAVRALARAADPGDVQELLGHARIATTQRYQRTRYAWSR